MSGRLLSWVVLSVVAVALAGCGEPNPPQQASQHADAPATMPAAGEVAHLAPAALAAMPVTGHCYLDKVNDQRSDHVFHVTAGDEAVFVGWAVNAELAAPAQAMFVLKGEKSYGLHTRVGGVRPDVAKALGSEPATKSGFHVESRLQQVAPGTYEAMIKVAQPTGGSTLCDLHRSIAVTR